MYLALDWDDTVLRNSTEVFGIIRYLPEVNENTNKLFSLSSANGTKANKAVQISEQIDSNET